MCHPLIFIVLQVLTLQTVTSYPCKDYILAYIPIEEIAYLLPESVTSYSCKDYIPAYIPIEEIAYFLPENIEAMPVPYYNNAFYDPWNFQGRIMQSARFPHRQTTGPVSFGGQVKATGGVTITGRFGNHGSGTFTSYSAPSTPLIVTPQPELPTTSNLLIDTISPMSTSLPTITTLPTVTLPSSTIDQPFTDIMPSTVSVPTMPLPFIVVTTTVPYNRELNGNVASSVKFSGMVPASGRVRISKHFC